MRLDELVSVREIRAIIKEEFLKFKDVKDPRVCINTVQWQTQLAARLQH